MGLTFRLTRAEVYIYDSVLMILIQFNLFQMSFKCKVCGAKYKTKQVTRKCEKSHNWVK